jgi:hypothetical protein
MRKQILWLFAAAVIGVMATSVASAGVSKIAKQPVEAQ